MFQAILTEDGKLVLGDLRSKGGEDWSLTGKSVTVLNKDEKKILDLALLPGKRTQDPRIRYWVRATVPLHSLTYFIPEFSIL
jgi:hypothetical protein